MIQETPEFRTLLSERGIVLDQSITEANLFATPESIDSLVSGEKKEVRLGDTRRDGTVVGFCKAEGPTVATSSRRVLAVVYDETKEGPEGLKLVDCILKN